MCEVKPNLFKHKLDSLSINLSQELIPIEVEQVRKKAMLILDNIVSSSGTRYEESADMFALTQNSFEEVALKLIKLPNKDALKMFVQRKLSSLRSQVSTL